MPLQALSLGREVDVWNPQTGVVHSVFAQAVNLLVSGEFWTVLGASRPDTPFGIRISSDGGFDVRAADRVHVRSGFVSLGKMIVDCRTASHWAPTQWSHPAPGLAARLCTVEQAARQRAWAESSDMADDVVTALRDSDANLAAAVRRTVGRGPGLTPSGDDVLAGIFALLTSGAAGTAGARAASRLGCALAPVLSSTPDVSRQLLQQASRGLPGRALHDLGKALIEGAPHDILTNCLDPVMDTGATSGADACMGLIAACRFIFPNIQMTPA